MCMLESRLTLSQIQRYELSGAAKWVLGFRYTCCPACTNWRRCVPRQNTSQDNIGSETIYTWYPFHRPLHNPLFRRIPFMYRVRSIRLLDVVRQASKDYKERYRRTLGDSNRNAKEELLSNLSHHHCPIAPRTTPVIIPRKAMSR
jgi:hypothetical protein